MNRLSPALAQLVSRVGQSEIAGQAGQAGKNGFTLDNAQQTGALMQRLVQHKNHQAADKTPDDHAMQAMLALLLARMPTPEVATAPGQPAQADTHIAMHLAQKQPILPAGMALKPTPGGESQGKNAPLNAQALPEALQKWVSQLSAASDITLTPQQQSQLAVLRAQDPRQVVMAEQPHSVAHKETAHPAAVVNPPLHRPAAKEKLPGRQAVAPAAAAAMTPAQPMHAAKTPVMDIPKTAPLPAQDQEWGEKLTGLLKDRIHFQINQQQQISTIRLDPPSLGKLDIAIQLDAGKLTVHITASQPDVCRSLQQLSEQLRQQLSGQNFGQVAVNVSTDSGSDRQQQQQRHQPQGDQILTARAISPETNGEHQRDPLLIKV
ncbi:flagellar hook-length control protein FliK [Atlantibacter subterraneus]|uniref:flagellar hook-length control protein FliK n=1 Tax=Atlantibacter subterraneus TaxID=255519 RepID=UPI00289D1BB4|nr:flagellar hook-length control protein FliK [Atlantibacter subterranea]